MAEDGGQSPDWPHYGKRKMQTPESYEKADIKKHLKAIGAWYCLPTTYGRGQSGTPDIVACIRGQFWGLEVKREGKAPTPLQNARMAEIELRGGKTAWGTAQKVIREIEAWRACRGS